MPTVRGCNLPDDLLYDVDNHIWFQEQGDGTVKLGMTTVATAMAGKLVAFTPKRVGRAVRAGKSDAVQFLLKAGADVGLTGSYNSESHVQLTPYCAAVYYGRGQIAELLLVSSSPPDIFRSCFLGDEQDVLRQLEARGDLLDAEDPSYAH